MYLYLDLFCSLSSLKMSFEIVKTGTYQGLFIDGRRIYSEPRKIKASRGKERSKYVLNYT